MIREILLVLAILIMIIRPVISEDPLYTITNGIAFNYSDNTNGQGSFAGYNNLINDRQEQLKSTNSGSGVIEREMLIGSYQRIYADLEYYSILSSSVIVAKNTMNYEPRTMAVGSGYYVSHPVRFNSRLGDKIQVKNYPSETAMVREIMYAAAINEDLRSGTATTHLYTGNYSDIGLGFIGLSEKVADGTTHIGVVHSSTHDRHYDKSAWGISSVAVDEVYSGTFDIKTNMSLVWPVFRFESDYSWLPCCSGGWNDMSSSDKKGFGMSANRIFDCSCYTKTKA